MTENLFQGTKYSPFHISVGAVLTNSQGEIAVHFYKKEDLPVESEEKYDIYLLMRETLHNGERLEDAVARGLMEEFGAKGTLRDFIGSLRGEFILRTSKVKVEKTTLYFHVEMTDFDPSKRDPNEPESASDILWVKPEKLYEIFLEQGNKYKRTDLDESPIIRHYIDYAQQ